MKFVAETAEDFNKALKTNVRYGMDGRLEIGSRNMLLDPTFRVLESNGRLRYWPVVGPASPVGRNIFLGRDRELDRKQNGSVAPLSDTSHWLTRDPTNGPGAPPASVSEYPAPDTPTLVVYRWDGRGGIPAGTYEKAYAWIPQGGMGANGVRLMTAPSPRRRINISQGDAFIQYLSLTKPATAVGLAILLTEPDNPDGPLFVVEVADVRAGVPEYMMVDGPVNFRDRAPSFNQTHRGAFAEHPAPEFTFVSGRRKMDRMDCEISYRFRTAEGLSASQKILALAVPFRRRSRAAMIEFPALPVWGVLSIIPQLRARDGIWYDLYYDSFGGEVPPGEKIWLPTDDPWEMPPGITLVRSERSKTDRTGMKSPDTALGSQKAVTDSTIRADDYRVRITDVYEEDDGSYTQSPPSAPALVTTTAGDIIRVALKESQTSGNNVPNDTYAERNRDRSVALWNLSSGVTARESVIAFDKNVGATLVDLANHQTAKVPVSASTVYAFRGGVQLARATAGRVDVLVWCYSSAGAFLGALTVHSRSTVGNSVGEIRVGPGQASAWPAGTTQAVMAVVGAGASGVNVAGEVYFLDFYVGATVPRRRYGRDPVSATEERTTPAPGGNYLVLVKDPTFTNGMGNGFEYYGAATAPLLQKYLMQGARFPVEPDTATVFSVHYSAEGATDGTTLLPVTLRDRAGRILARPGPAVPAFAGDASPGRSSVAIPADPDASYIQIEPSTLGAGRIRVWGPQHERGTAMTTWTNAYLSQGTIELTFDTAPEGYPDGASLAGVFGAKRWIEADAVATLPGGTNVTVEVATRQRLTQPWSAYTQNTAAALGQRYLKIRVTLLASSDLSRSPRLTAVQALAEPKRSQLYRKDGSMYHGGVLAEQVPAGGYAENTELTRMSDGSLRVHELFPAAEEISLVLKAFTDEGARQVMLDSASGDRTFEVEGWGFERRVVLTGVRFGVNRMEIVDGKDYWVHATEEITAPVIDSERTADD